MIARICSAHKANVLEVSAFRREVATNVHAAEYGDVELSHVYVDNAAMIAGPIGMLPSASPGLVDAHGRREALYEPIHGSAPDIAVQCIANPL